MGELIEVTKRNGLRLLVDPDDRTPAIQELLRDWRQRQNAAESARDAAEVAPELVTAIPSSVAPRRKPGRPRQTDTGEVECPPAAEVVPVPGKDASTTSAAPLKRKPGRPRKMRK